MKKKIAVITQNDNFWTLIAFNNLFKELHDSDKFDLVACFECKTKFANIKSNKVIFWYLRIFGLYNVFKMAIFSFFGKIKIISDLTYSKSLKKLANKYKVEYKLVNSPNSLEFIDWLKLNKIDVLIINVGHILKDEIFKISGLIIINKHASLLPINKGIFPYFWAVVNKNDQGISFHQVTAKIDAGKIYYQQKVQDEKYIRSMIAFYLFCHLHYCEMLMEAIENMISNNSLVNDSNINSYYSLPDKDSYKTFRSNNGKIIMLKDLFLIKKL